MLGRGLRQSLAQLLQSGDGGSAVTRQRLKRATGEVDGAIYDFLKRAHEPVRPFDGYGLTARKAGADYVKLKARQSGASARRATRVCRVSSLNSG